MPETSKPAPIDPQQEELARGTPPARTPGAVPEAAPAVAPKGAPDAGSDADLQPDQQPVRDTPDLESPGGEA